MDICDHCDRPEDLHCPGCGVCWPDYTCTIDCPADEDEINAVLTASDEWYEANA